MKYITIIFGYVEHIPSLKKHNSFLGFKVLDKPFHSAKDILDAIKYYINEKDTKTEGLVLFFDIRKYENKVVLDIMDNTLDINVGIAFDIMSLDEADFSKPAFREIIDDIEAIMQIENERGNVVKPDEEFFNSIYESMENMDLEKYNGDPNNTKLPVDPLSTKLYHVIEMQRRMMFGIKGFYTETSYDDEKDFERVEADIPEDLSFKIEETYMNTIDLINAYIKGNGKNEQ